MVSIFKKLTSVLTSRKSRSPSSLVTPPDAPLSSTVKSEAKPPVAFPPAPSRAKQHTAKKKSVSLSTSPSLAEDRLLKLLEDLKKREEDLKRRLDSLQKQEDYLRRKESSVDERDQKTRLIQQEIETLKEKTIKQLEQIAGLDQKKAQDLLMKKAEKDLSNWLARHIEEARESLKSQEDVLAQEIISSAIRHGVTDYVGEYTVSTLSLKNPELKGKIIGREGRNIRAFEKITGVELELDESDDIRLSSFDPVRREIAKISLEKLIKDGRIQPVRIEEVVKQTKDQMEKILLEEGQRICQEVGVFHLPVDLVKLIGKFKFRFSHGQNLAIHTIEETKIALALARDLKADVKVVRLACLLHDVGKVITDEEGTHIQLGADLLRRYRFPEKVINAVAEHHEDKPFSSIESVIVWIADAASGSRPGARYEAHEEYVKRLTSIEETAKSFDGVKDVAAYQAGREVRVIVDPEKISDDQLIVLTQKIAQQLDEEARWAGQIKVVGIRETRSQSTIVPKRK